MSTKIHGPAYRIVTPRLVIRCWSPADAWLLKATVDKNIEHLKPWMPWATNHPQDIQDHINLLRRFRGEFDLDQDFVYGVFDRDETRVIGGTGLHTRLGPNVREIGYWIDREFTRQGLATELSAALTKVAFEVDNAERVEIHCAADNHASAAVPRKLGYTLDATLRCRDQLLDGRLHDTMIWSFLRSEYPAGLKIQVDCEAFDALGRRLL